jgi:hypothetical protein
MSDIGNKEYKNLFQKFYNQNYRIYIQQCGNLNIKNKFYFQ